MLAICAGYSVLWQPAKPRCVVFVSRFKKRNSHQLTRRSAVKWFQKQGKGQMLVSHPTCLSCFIHEPYTDFDLGGKKNPSQERPLYGSMRSPPLKRPARHVQEDLERPGAKGWTAAPSQLHTPESSSQGLWKVIWKCTFKEEIRGKRGHGAGRGRVGGLIQHDQCAYKRRSNTDTKG